MQVFLLGGREHTGQMWGLQPGVLHHDLIKDCAQLQRASPSFSALLWEWLKLDFFTLTT